MKNILLAVLLCFSASVCFAEKNGIVCEGDYNGHVQGIVSDGSYIYWSWTSQLAKTDMTGKVLKVIDVCWHHGDLCLHDGKLYVAVNQGKFNQEAKAKNDVYVYNAADLTYITKYPVPELRHGAGGMDWYDGHFYVVGGLPKGYEHNFVYKYDEQFRFIDRYVIPSGYTKLGIQTACFAKDTWFFGTYSGTTLICSADLKYKGFSRAHTSLGLTYLPDGRFLYAVGFREENAGRKRERGKVFYTTLDKLLK